MSHIIFSLQVIGSRKEKYYWKQKYSVHKQETMSYSTVLEKTSEARCNVDFTLVSSNENAT